MLEGQKWLTPGRIVTGIALAGGLAAYAVSPDIRQRVDHSTQNAAEAFLASVPEYDQLPEGVESHIVFNGQGVDVYRTGSQDYIIASDKNYGGEEEVFQALDEMRARCGDVPYDANWDAAGSVVRVLVSVPTDKIDCWEAGQQSTQN